MITPLLAQQFGILNISELEPLLPIHILWINLVTDSLPALALAVDPAARNIMKRKPLKSNNGIFTRGMTRRIIYQGITIGVITLIAFVLGLSTSNVSEHEKIMIGQTMAFCVLALSQLVHVYNVRDNKVTIFKTGIFNNKMLILATLASTALMLVILFIPLFQSIFSLASLSLVHIVEIIILILMPVVIVEIAKLLKINTTRDE